MIGRPPLPAALLRRLRSRPPCHPALQVVQPPILVPDAGDLADYRAVPCIPGRGARGCGRSDEEASTRRKRRT